MFSNKLIIVLCIVGVVKANNDLRIIDSIQQEQPCTSQGGLCTIAADCPKGLLVEERGLCPTQRSRGVECCYGLSVKETRCNKRGGHCSTEFCTKRLIDNRATDCPKDSICCTLV